MERQIAELFVSAIEKKVMLLAGDLESDSDDFDRDNHRERDGCQ